MAKKVILISDLGGAEIPEDEQVELRVLEFPELSQPVRLDASKTETDRLKLEAKPLALLEVVSSDGATERIAVDAGQLTKAIRGDAHEVMSRAEGLYVPPPQPEPAAPRRGRRPRSEGAAAHGEKVDYTAPEHFGQLHRGRLTDEEIKLVKENPEQASRNRQAQGNPAIDWDNPKERSRYNLTDEDVTRIKAAAAQ